MDCLLQDLSYAWRSLVRGAASTLVVLLTLGVAMGTSAVIFTVVDAIVQSVPGARAGPRGVRRRAAGGVAAARVTASHVPARRAIRIDRRSRCAPESYDTPSFFFASGRAYAFGGLWPFATASALR